ncbi:glycosyltransferase family 2 protein [uncultured Desulfobacter sp.]|uniref:glycosyltransferase family 2 protein n=1 Tax=uncultured Desulfobacter sp. TaxID=240139 RepID=UPI0029F5ADEA|nr:glycosyltransferase family 2 protein [uncultured Desulfobacter sp.]
MEFSISIIVPAYNEEEAIFNVVSELNEKFPDYELIVVDDGSIDRTCELAKKAGAKVIKHSKNWGYGASLKTGILNAAGEYVVTCDADGQHRVADIKLLLNDYEEYDAIIGIRNNDSHAPLLRKPGKFVLKCFFNYLTGEKIEDFNCGLRVFKKSVITKYLHLTCDQFSFSTTSMFALLKMKRRIKCMPIKVKKRIGKSSVRQIKHGTYALLLILRLTVLFNPLKVFLHGVLLFFIMGFVSLFLDCSTNGEFTVGTTTSLMFVSALIVFMFALLCDQVSAIRRQMNE